LTNFLLFGHRLLCHSLVLSELNEQLTVNNKNSLLAAFTTIYC